MKNKWIAKMCAITLAASFLFTGCGSIHADETLATCDGEVALTLGYGNFTARYMQSMYDSLYLSYYGETMWSTQTTTDDDGNTITMEESVKSQLLDAMETTYLLYIHADDYGVSLTDEELAQVTEAAEEFLAENDEETLEAMSATQEIVEQYLTYEAYEQKVTAAIEAACDTVITDEEAATSTFSYVKFSTADTTDSDGNTVSLTDEEKEALLAQAQAVSDASDFDTEAETQGATVSSSSFDSDDSPLDDSIMEVLREMSDGEVSDVIEIEDDGYYVVRMDSTYDEEATEENRETLQEEAVNDYYDEIVSGWKDEVDWEVNESAWAKVSFDSLFTTVSDSDDSDDSDDE